ncbi:capsid protein [Sigmofec virus UA08Rod_17746]|uniref:Capsid protein n=1 Tax=Sigmofec virus UA08Rod_17746 TaxID=2929263 RepID=A0A976N0Q0_9VIRU|nr:capsid protein [Sigmofec virus UA08Rod_17746]
MAYRRYGRWRTRRFRSSRRRYRIASRRFKRRYSRRSRRGGINATRSRTVRISTQIAIPYTYNDPLGTEHPIPLVFTPTQLPGFTEYSSTFSEFRILKARCKVHLALPGDSEAQAVLTNQPYTYLRVPSRPYIEDLAQTSGTAGQGGSPRPIYNIIRSSAPSVDLLRQSRWQRQYYPSDIKNAVSFKFYPYTLAWCGRPVGTANTVPDNAASFVYLKYQSARRWMPMSFLGVTQTATAPADDVSFLGPYFVRLFSTQPDSQALSGFNPVCTLTVYCQFRGQK